MERVYSRIGDVVLAQGNAADRTQGFWQIEKVYDPVDHYGITYSTVEYYFRCPWCNALKMSTAIATIKRFSGPYDTEGVRDCLNCECDRHYWLELKGLRDAILTELFSRGRL